MYCRMKKEGERDEEEERDVKSIDIGKVDGPGGVIVLSVSPSLSLYRSLSQAGLQSGFVATAK